MSTEESGPVTTPAAEDRTKFGNDMFGRGAAAARKKFAAALGRPELEDSDKLEAYFKDQKTAEDKRLAEAGRFQELADKNAREAETERQGRARVEQELQEERFRNQFILAAQGKVADIDLALSQTRAEDRQFGEGGKVVAIDAVIDRILKEKPILKAGAGGKPPIGGAIGAGGEPEQGKHAAEIKDRMDKIEAIKQKPRQTMQDATAMHQLRGEIDALRKA